eukprot:scaffold29847_cov68-Phaeocystis_antarctica.AAC.5
MSRRYRSNRYPPSVVGGHERHAPVAEVNPEESLPALQLRHSPHRAVVARGEEGAVVGLQGDAAFGGLDGEVLPGLAVHCLAHVAFRAHVEKGAVAGLDADLEDLRGATLHQVHLEALPVPPVELPLAHGAVGLRLNELPLGQGLPDEVVLEDDRAVTTGVRERHGLAGVGLVDLDAVAGDGPIRDDGDPVLGVDSHLSFGLLLGPAPIVAPIS